LTAAALVAMVRDARSDTNGASRMQTMRSSLLPLIALALAACQQKPEAAPTTPQAALAPVAAEDPAPPEPVPELPPGHPPAGQLPPGHPPAGQLPPGHPPAGQPARPAMGPMAVQVEAETGVERPLPLEGSGSIAELRGRLAKNADTSTHAALEDAFRKVFTVQRDRRDVPGADGILTPLAKDADPAVAALAERTLGYVRVSSGFDQVGAKARYARALELDPDYGEAHYAMAFMLAMSDRAAGKAHFDRAMALGVPDTRNLAAQFFAGTP
jgi:hypothetical protein